MNRRLRPAVLGVGRGFRARAALRGLALAGVLPLLTGAFQHFPGVDPASAERCRQLYESRPSLRLDCERSKTETPQEKKRREERSKPAPPPSWCPDDFTEETKQEIRDEIWADYYACMKGYGEASAFDTCADQRDRAMVDRCVAD